jgi:hypothetical protein
MHMIGTGCALHFSLFLVLASGGFLFGPRLGVSPLFGVAAGAGAYLLLVALYIFVRTFVEQVFGPRGSSPDEKSK